MGSGKALSRELPALRSFTFSAAAEPVADLMDRPSVFAPSVRLDRMGHLDCADSSAHSDRLDRSDDAARWVHSDRAPDISPGRAVRAAARLVVSDRLDFAYYLPIVDGRFLLQGVLFLERFRVENLACFARSEFLPPVAKLFVLCRLAGRELLYFRSQWRRGAHAQHIAALDRI